MTVLKDSTTVSTYRGSFSAYNDTRCTDAFKGRLARWEATPSRLNITLVPLPRCSSNGSISGHAALAYDILVVSAFEAAQIVDGTRVEPHSCGTAEFT